MQNKFGALKQILSLELFGLYGISFHIIKHIKPLIGLFGNASALFFCASLWFGYLTKQVKAFLQ